MHKGFWQCYCIYSTSERYSLKGLLKVQRLFTVYGYFIRTTHPLFSSSVFPSWHHPRVSAELPVTHAEQHPFPPPPPPPTLPPPTLPLPPSPCKGTDGWLWSLCLHPLPPLSSHLLIYCFLGTFSIKPLPSCLLKQTSAFLPSQANPCLPASSSKPLPSCLLKQTPAFLLLKQTPAFLPPQANLCLPAS